MSKRIVLLFLFFGLLWSLLIGRSVYLQLVPNPQFDKMQKRQFKTVVNIEGRRGFVYDRNSKELAASVIAYSLYADPSLITAPRNVSMRLGPILNVFWPQIYKKIKNKKRRFVWLKRRMSKQERDRILSWKVRGLGFIEESKRVYPNDNVLSHTLGFVGGQGQGLGGLESSFEHILNGSQTKLKVQRDARGRPLFINGRWFNENPDGYNLHLTIDLELQYKLERELRAAIEKHEAEGAYGVILNAKTSEVLAMASLPDYNPNTALKYSVNRRRNKVLSDPFEPGSTLKTMTIATSIKNHLSRPNSKYYCENGRMQIGRKVIREADSHHSFKWLSVEDILAFSSNIGTTKMAFEIGDKNLRSSLLDFGFGAKTELGLGGESRGILPTLPWNKHLISNISFGHGIAVTPLQLANAYATVANGGKLMQAYLVSKITDNSGRVIQNFEPKEVRRVLSLQHADTIKNMLHRVTESGTGKKAKVKNFSVAGKTGTAQKINHETGQYEKGAYISSFAGFIPVENPEYVIFVAVDKPQKKYYGSEVAGPIFSKVASFAVRNAGLEPEIQLSQFKKDSREQISLQDKKRIKIQKSAIAKIKNSIQEEKWEKLPNLQGLSMREVMSHIQKQDLDVQVYGSGYLSKTVPEIGEKITDQTKLRLYFKRAEN